MTIGLGLGTIDSENQKVAELEERVPLPQAVLTKFEESYNRP
jgi:hypothetical protein